MTTWEEKRQARLAEALGRKTPKRAPKTCLAPGCRRARRASGLCMMHYGRHYRTGVVTVQRTERAAPEPRAAPPDPRPRTYPIGSLLFACPPCRPF